MSLAVPTASKARLRIKHKLSKPRITVEQQIINLFKQIGVKLLPKQIKFTNLNGIVAVAVLTNHKSLSVQHAQQVKRGLNSKFPGVNQNILSLYKANGQFYIKYSFRFPVVKKRGIAK